LVVDQGAASIQASRLHASTSLCVSSGQGITAPQVAAAPPFNPEGPIREIAHRYNSNGLEAALSGLTGVLGRSQFSTIPKKQRIVAWSAVSLLKVGRAGPLRLIVEEKRSNANWSPKRGGRQSGFCCKATT